MYDFFLVLDQYLCRSYNFMPIYAKFPKFMIFYDFMPTGRPVINNCYSKGAG
jgi:hypothetical protein